jgi:hypothetical protein
MVISQASDDKEALSGRQPTIYFSGMILLLSKTKTQKYFSFLLIQGRKVLEICSNIPLAKKIMQGTDVLHDSLLKNFQNVKELRHFSRKQKNFWPEKAKTHSLLLKIAPLCANWRAAILKNRRTLSLF